MGPNRTTESVTLPCSQSPHIHRNIALLNGAASRTGVDRWFENLESKTFPLLNRRYSSCHERVKIAILDTGIDGKHPGIQYYSNRIKGYMSFVEPGIKPYKSSHGMSTRKLKDLCVDEHGNGTHCASVLLRMAPYADIFVCKVAVDVNPTADALAKAIDHASREWHVDIISISLGLEKSLEPVERAIDRAIQENKVLFFAAAKNESLEMSGRIAFPAKHHYVFCIHSATYSGIQPIGSPLRFKSGKVYSALGEDLLAAWPETSSEIRSGSPTATPVAAATAALLLEFARQMSSATGKQSPLMEILAPRMKEEWFMERIFDDMTSQLDGAKFIIPWRWLDVDNDLGLGCHDAADDSNPYSARNQYEIRLYQLFSVDHVLC